MSIVVGYVPNPEGRAALHTSAVEAVRRDVPLIVVRTQAHGRVFSPEDSQRFESELAEMSAPLTAPALRHEVRVFPDSTDPSENLLTVAEQAQADVIVIGLRRRSKVGKLFLGSHAQRVLLDAPCPVLAVKAVEPAW